MGKNKAEEYFISGSEYERQGKNRKAENAYRKAIELDPDNSDSYCGLGNVLDAQGKHDEARQYLMKAIGLLIGNEKIETKAKTPEPDSMPTFPPSLKDLFLPSPPPPQRPFSPPISTPLSESPVTSVTSPSSTYTLSGESMSTSPSPVSEVEKRNSTSFFEQVAEALGMADLPVSSTSSSFKPPTPTPSPTPQLPPPMRATLPAPMSVSLSASRPAPVSPPHEQRLTLMGILRSRGKGISPLVP